MCIEPSKLTVNWEGWGHEKLTQPSSTKSKVRNPYHKLVKVMVALICEICRLTHLPRTVILTQWDLRGTHLEPLECTCQWDRRFIQYCHSCTLKMRNDRLPLVGDTKGYQVRRYVDPLKVDCWNQPPVAMIRPLDHGDEPQQLLAAGPKAQPL